MRSRKIMLTLGLIGAIGLGLAFVSGCSSDKRPTVVEPTINDQYTNVQAEINEVVDQTISLMSMSLEMFDSNRRIDNGTDEEIRDDIMESSFDPDSVLRSDDWYILTSNELSAAFGSVLIDSILFLNDGANVEFASDGNGLIIRHLSHYANINTDVSYTDFTIGSDLTFSGLNTNEAIISGDWSATTIDQIVDGTTEIRTFNVVADVKNLVVEKPVDGWGGGCPASGEIDFTVGLSFQDGDAEAVTSSWTFTVTFTDGVTAVTASDGTVDATYSRDCCTP